MKMQQQPILHDVVVRRTFMVVLISSLAILSSSIVCLALLSPIKSPRLLRTTGAVVIHTTGTITTTSTPVATTNKRSVISHSTTTSPVHRIISSTSFPSFMTTRTSVASAATTTLDDFKNASHRRRPQHIIIAGAGIIGTSTAYYLSKLHHEEKKDKKEPTTATTTTPTTLKITIIDPTGTIAPAASGKAGGFLALDWNDFSPHALGPLARRGFELHSILAQELGQERIQYRRLSCACISVSEQGEHDDDVMVKGGRPSGKKLEGIAQEWNHDNASVLGVKQLGDERTIAQVHPKMLCCAMWEDMNDKMKYPNVQIQLVKGKVVHTKPSRSGSGNASDFLSWDVHLQDGTILKGDAILYACGPWTTLGNCITGVKYHSVIIPTRPKVLSQAIFYNGLGDPEVYPRSDGTAYCCGFPDPPVVVKEEPGREEVRQEKVDEIVNAVRVASGSSSRGGGGGGGVLGQEPDIVQSCYLPCTPDNIPMMGKVMVMDQNDESSSTNVYVDGCYVAAGHGCWGILMGPATGEAMAKLILTGEESSSEEYVDLTPFSPQRFLLK